MWRGGIVPIWNDMGWAFSTEVTADSGNGLIYQSLKASVLVWHVTCNRTGQLAWEEIGMGRTAGFLLKRERAAPAGREGMRDARCGAKAEWR